MIAQDSPLKKLPADVDRKQALFIDGIRHAAEIASVAYLRLRDTLTHIALNDIHENEIAGYSTMCFLDAWAFVDAIDRFRLLWMQMTRSNMIQPIQGEPTLDEVTKPFRDLRNVADHIAQRIDLIISKNSAALGVISWFTAIGVDPVRGFICAIIPGTLRDHKAELKTPSGHTLEMPTGRICLEAGGFDACLCDVLPHILKHIRYLEEILSSRNAELGVDASYAGSDIIFKAHVHFEGGGITRMLGDEVIYAFR